MLEGDICYCYYCYGVHSCFDGNVVEEGKGPCIDEIVCIDSYGHMDIEEVDVHVAKLNRCELDQWLCRDVLIRTQ